MKAVDSHTYESYFFDDWCIGDVPHGGVVTGNFLAVAKLHFETTLKDQDQPHTLACHFDFLRRTSEGPCTFVVSDTKLGRQTSVIHVTLSQGGRTEVVGYITRTNFHQESGISLDTDFQMHPAPPPVDLVKLGQNQDSNWIRQPEMPFAEFRKASTKIAFHFPRSGQLHKSLGDEWVHMRTGELFTNTTLGFVADMFPMPVESFRDPENRTDVVERDERGEIVKRHEKAVFWYPTVLLNIDFKKALKEEGEEWLFSRCKTKMIKNGRMDLEIVILDAQGDIVAISHHICLVVDASRNTAPRRTGNGAESKI